MMHGQKNIKSFYSYFNGNPAGWVTSIFVVYIYQI